MATTSIGSTRQTGTALERYPDAVFMRDDRLFYFGTDGDFAIEYDEDGNNVVLTKGADIRVSDTQQFQFGDSGDVKLWYEPTSSSDTMYITGLKTSDPNKTGALFTSDTDTALHISA